MESFLPQIHSLLGVPVSDLRVLRELGAGQRVADVVAARNMRKKWLSLPQVLSVKESVLLAQLRVRGAMRIDRLEKRCGLSRGGLRDGSLDRLINAKVLKRQRGGVVALARSTRSAVHVLAFEMKLTKWRDAVQQARVYTKYADLSYVVLPPHSKKLSKKIESRCEQAGVGLVFVDSSDYVVIRAARRNHAHDWRREYVLSRLLNGDSKQQLDGNTAANSGRVACGVHC